MTDSKSDKKPIEPIDLEKALAELSNLIKPIVTEDKKQLLQLFYYVLLLWGSFHVYQVEPEVAGGEGGGLPIPNKGGWRIMDYGDHLSTSAGANYSTYCTGKMITATQKMIGVMAQRGATRVRIFGHDIARRAAWIECEDLNIAINNFAPTEDEKKIRERVKTQRQRARELIEKEVVVGRRPE